MHAWVNYIAYACQYNEEASINIRNHVPLIVLRKTYVESCFKIELRFLRDTLYVINAGCGYGVVVSMFDFHRSDRGSNPGRGGKISSLRRHYRAAPLASV